MKKSQIIQENGGQILDNIQLKTILVKPNKDKTDVEVSKIIWKNTKTGEIQSTAINSLFLSLGPSMKSLKLNIPPEYLSLGARLKKMFDEYERRKKYFHFEGIF